MPELADFLTERIAEDEESARRMAEFACEICGCDVAHACPGLMGNARAYDDPRRVLAEVEAKRRIVAHLAESHEWNEEPLLRLLALPYADHADYDERWRP